MTAQPPAVDWLPDHHLGVLTSLGRSDALIAQVGDLLHRYHQSPGPLSFQESRAAGRVTISVQHIAPLPAAVPVLVADTISNLRAAIEHTVFAEASHRLGRAPTGNAARALEMPARTTHASFVTWLNDKRRATLPVRPGSPLARRIGDLQPYQRNKHPDQHPLAVLVDHSNTSKHRAPLVATVQLGAVIADRPTSDLVLLDAVQGRPLRVGDTLAETPVGRPVPLSIWPKVCIQRPASGTWSIVMHELRDLEHWVRTVAKPHLITGQHEALQPIPPGMDITSGQANLRDLLRDANPISAAERADIIMQAVIAREGLAETLTVGPDPLSTETARQWALNLTDEQALSAAAELAGERGHRDILGPHGAQDLTEMTEVIARLRADATAAKPLRPQSDGNKDPSPLTGSSPPPR